VLVYKAGDILITLIWFQSTAYIPIIYNAEWLELVCGACYQLLLLVHQDNLGAGIVKEQLN